MISAKILAKSVNPLGKVITTFLLTYPRFIHAEFMTHRCFSRNAASSRAIPIEKMMHAVAYDPAWPERWGKAAKGMQDGGELREEIASDIKSALARLCVAALNTVEIISDIGLAKQVANRYLEPWSHIKVIATATDLTNFFKLRANPAAQPEFQVLAYRMLSAYLDTLPELLNWDDWHIPVFEGVNKFGEDTLPEALRLKVATARCARLSYLTHEGDFNVSKDCALHDRLAESGHWSPFEHCALATDGEYKRSNFDFIEPSGWMQYRKNFSLECETGATDMDFAVMFATKPDWITV